jgi:ribosomal-protein-alanine N-acetyltransferase
LTDERQLSTERLELVAATIELCRAALEGRESLAQQLGAALPDDWPPPLNDESAIRCVLDRLREAPRPDEAAGWLLWFVLLQPGPQERRIVIGTAGLKGPPDETGAVEVGYSIVEGHQRRGYATEAVGRLIQWAFDHEAVQRVVAHTMPELTPSIRVLEKLGFTCVGCGDEEGTIRFELSR